MANSMTYGGTDLSGASYGLTVTRFPMELLSDARLNEAEYGGRHGSAVQGTFRKAHRFSIEGRVSASSRANLLTQLRAIAGVVKSTTEALLTLDCFSGWGWYARLHGPLIIQPQSQQSATVQFNWLVPDGYAVATSATTQSVTIDASPKTFNVPAAGSVAGNEHSEPVWVLTNTDAATITTVVLANTTRSETLTWHGALAQNYKLRVDSERCHIEKSTDGGTTWTNAMSGLASGSVFPMLTAGSSNACSVTGFAAGTLGITYTARYV